MHYNRSVAFNAWLFSMQKFGLAWPWSFRSVYW